MLLLQQQTSISHFLSLIRYMKFIHSYRYCYRIAVLAFVLMAGVCHAGTHYITFNDGHLCVFPDSCIQSLTSDAKRSICRR